MTLTMRKTLLSKLRISVKQQQKVLQFKLGIHALYNREIVLKLQVLYKYL